MTLLTIVQDACNEVGVTAPSTVVTNSDQTITQMLALANRGGKSLAQRYPWQELVAEWTFTTVAAESQGTVETIMPGFNWDLYQTIWNRTTRFPIQGPLFPAEWQFLKAMNIAGPWPQFRIRGGDVICIPIPTAGQILAGEYVTRYWCQSSGAAGQEKWAADTDTGVLREDWLTLDLIWRWKRAKGLDYAEEKQEFELQINNAMSRNGSNRIMSLEDRSVERDYPNGIAVQVGNWPLT